MSRTFTRAAGVAGLIGSLLIIATFALGSLSIGAGIPPGPFYGTGALLLLVNAISLLAQRKGRPGWLSNGSLVAAMAGLLIIAIYAVFDTLSSMGIGFAGDFWAVLIFSLLVTLAGMSIYAITAAAAKKASWWLVAPLAFSGLAIVSIMLILSTGLLDLSFLSIDQLNAVSTVLMLAFFAMWGILSIVTLLTGSEAKPAPTLSTRSALPRTLSVLLLPVALLAAAAIYFLAQTISATPTSAGPTSTPTPITIPPSGPRPVVIDTDMAMDDWLGILYLLQRKDVDVVAITVTGTGEAHCEPGVRNARGLLALAGYAQVPVACGRETPFEGGHSFPNEWREGVDNMLGLALPAPQRPISDPGMAAPELLASLSNDYAGSFYVVALGPLTNIADALEIDPLLAGRLADLYIMGGAVDVPGNVQLPDGSMAPAEWNFYADPHAAALVFESRPPITLVSLDATKHVPLTTSYVKQLEANHTTPEADFTYRVLKENSFLFEPGAYYLWDTLAAVLFTDNTLSTFREERVMVSEEVAESGRTIPAPNGTLVRIPASVDAARFQRLFLDVLNAR